MFQVFYKSRKYPIKYDKYGRSTRQRAFELFDEGWRPAQVARELNMIPRTAYRYFECWKKLPKDLETTYKLWRITGYYFYVHVVIPKNIQWALYEIEIALRS